MNAAKMVYAMDQTLLMAVHALYEPLGKQTTTYVAPAMAASRPLQPTIPAKKKGGRPCAAVAHVKITNREAAGKMRVSTSTIQRWSKGEGKPPPDWNEGLVLYDSVEFNRLCARYRDERTKKEFVLGENSMHITNQT